MNIVYNILYIFICMTLLQGQHMSKAFLGKIMASIVIIIPNCARLHPGELTCPLKMDYFNRKYIFQPSIFRGHVSFGECCVHNVTF